MNKFLFYILLCFSYYATAQSGCLEAENGQYPYSIFDVYCNIQFQNITTVAEAGTFSNVAVLSGRTYTFKSSIPTDFLTLSNEAGTEVISYGINLVEYSPTTDEIIRFYVHSNDQCGSETTYRTKSVKCDPGPDPNDPIDPVEGCLEGPLGNAGIDYTPFCNGYPEVITDYMFPGNYINVWVTGGTLYTFKSSVATDYITIGNFLGTKAIASGTSEVEWTAAGDGFIRFYLSLDENCGSDIFEDPRIITVQCGEKDPPSEGCLEAPSGQFPFSVFIPTCNTVIESVAPMGYAGEYSMIQVTANTEYTLYSSIETDMITIGNEEGTEVLDYGFGTLSWTADSDRLIRFYTHSNPSCGLDIATRTRAIKCGDPFVATEPDFQCFQGDGLASNNYEDGYNIAEGTSSVADDFVVENEFTIQQVRLNIFSSDEIPSFSLNFLADDNDMPGEIIFSLDDLVPSEQLIIGATDSYLIYQIKIDLPAPLTLSTGKYWLQPIVHNSFSGAFWEVTSTGSSYSNVNIKSTPQETWHTTDYQAVFFISGECNILSISDSNKPEVLFSPNPVKDSITFSSTANIQSIEVYDMLGQLILNKKPIDGNLNVSDLQAGVYLFKVKLDVGFSKIFKIIKE